MKTLVFVILLLACSSTTVTQSDPAGTGGALTRCQLVGYHAEFCIPPDAGNAATGGTTCVYPFLSCDAGCVLAGSPKNCGACGFACTGDLICRHQLDDTYRCEFPGTGGTQS